MTQIPNEVVLLLYGEAKPGKKEELRHMLVSQVTGARHKAGNINYELHEVINEPSIFILYEQWNSQAAFDAYRNLSQFRKTMARADELLDEGFAAGLKLLDKLRPAPQEHLEVECCSNFRSEICEYPTST